MRMPWARPFAAPGPLSVTDMAVGAYATVLTQYRGAFGYSKSLRKAKKALAMVHAHTAWRTRMISVRAIRS